MKRSPRVGGGILIAALMLSILGCRTSQPLRSAPAGTPAPPTQRMTLAALDWMIGHWRGAGLGGVAEEINLQPIGNAMPAVFRLSRDGQPQFYEFILYEETDTGVSMRLHHFRPGLERWEDLPVTFDLMRVWPNAALFGERNDAAERTQLIYRRTGKQLTAELIEMESGSAQVVARFEYDLVSQPSVEGHGR